MHKKAVIYCRTATRVPEDEVNSLVNQERRCRDYTISNGYSVLCAFKDEAVSRSRPDLARMLALVESGHADFKVVLVDSYCRLFRNLIEARTFIETLQGRGIEIVSITQPVPPGPAGEMIRAFFMVFDQYLSAETGKHVKRSMRENARRGFWCGGQPPYGYTTAPAGAGGKVVRKRLAVEPTEAATVRLIFSLFLNGAGTSGPLNVKCVTEWLNNRGYRARNGSRWGVGKIRKILTNRTLIGTYEFGRSQNRGDPVTVPAPAIIPIADFKAVQRSLD